MLLVLTACGGERESADSLAAQQAALGWGPEHCAPPPDGVQVGSRLGDQLDGLVLQTCEGVHISLNELCGAHAAWLSFAHAWCPHCREGAALAESLHATYADRGLASVNVLVEWGPGEAPSGEHCEAWRDTHGQDRVLTLYDAERVSFRLWDENYTALNVFLDADRVIRAKLHTDLREHLEAGIEASLPGEE